MRLSAAISDALSNKEEACNCDNEETAMVCVSDDSEPKQTAVPVDDDMWSISDEERSEIPSGAVPLAYPSEIPSEPVPIAYPSEDEAPYPLAVDEINRLVNAEGSQPEPSKHRERINAEKKREIC